MEVQLKEAFLMNYHTMRTGFWWLAELRLLDIPNHRRGKLVVQIIDLLIQPSQPSPFFSNDLCFEER